MREVLRTGVVVAAGLVTAAALTGCSSDSEKSDSGKGADAAKSSQAPGASGSSSGGGGDSGAGTAALEGGWAGKTDDKAVIMSVASGKAVLVTEQQACTGTVQDTGKVMLTLKCADGDTRRTTGAIESNDGKTIVVSWDSGTKDTLAKTAPGALPSGLPDLPAS
ncbi:MULTISPECIES: hypothetical protein [unclassified Streptomyces]|uniref:hypothetical protein n=1 Tax=unclassified Streptomyces TaxID=2593676 RepID=UPI002250EFD7|nr:MULTISPECIES: hypothetical protein [unclassified Streptomyces]WSP55880.1 hypothetical protein OG306_16895 [Streptomyces sp. NBC_01241]WSU23384.1 hypothetical protein OG508_22195 [Streptomyces sp. NBC_01108]MCX4787595.1 hypothetical protein [Streptomyces sp. NBC_01221]MCX4796620.1 hypothetical protein [Streptomyces sp. NBC_01242]WSJ37855.1 hypothetical protein OG772_18825 [Streptomyces sp. NBC_01321]